MLSYFQIIFSSHCTLIQITFQRVYIIFIFIQTLFQHLHPSKMTSKYNVNINKVGRRSDSTAEGGGGAAQEMVQTEAALSQTQMLQEGKSTSLSVTSVYGLSRCGFHVEIRSCWVCVVVAR